LEPPGLEETRRPRIAGNVGGPVANIDDEIKCKRNEDEERKESDPAPNLLEDFGRER
jgi:hypothetical protein